MTPAARVAAAIEVLDEILAGAPAEKALTGWARRSRFAGSGDRAAIRDHVFDAIRCRRSFAALGGAETGRGLMIGAMRAADTDPAALFTGEGHAPAPLSAADGQGAPPEGRFAALDCPDWLGPELEASLAPDFEPVMQALRLRAPVTLRVNARKADVEEVRRALTDEGIEAKPHPLTSMALTLGAGARRIGNSPLYHGGMVEIQDAASQAVVEALPLRDGQRVLDLCAGGGGKTLAMAARAELDLHAFDIAPRRMKDLPARADRAGVRVTLHDHDSLDRAGTFDLVLVDAPCSGSGSWRRTPQAKWDLTPERLDELTAMQDTVLSEATARTAQGGVLAYATCSLLSRENDARVAALRASEPGLDLRFERRWTPRDGGDGFYLAVMDRN